MKKRRIPNRFPELDEKGYGTPVYGFDGKRVTMGQWVTMTESMTQAVADTWMRQGGETFRVSTVLLGLDYSFGSAEKPLIFETALFSNRDVDIIGRYATIQKARAGHRKVVRYWRELLNERRKLHGSLLHNGRKP